MLLMPGPGDADDWELVNRNDAASLDALFRRHRDFVYRVIWSQVGQPEVAEDLTQEVFLKVARRRQRLFRRARFRTWLYRVAVNTAADFRRRQRRETPLKQWHLPPLPDDASQADHGALLAGLRALPLRQRQVVVLRTLEGLSTRETAELLRIGEGSVKTHLHRALENLRAFFQPSRGEPPC